MLKIHTFTWKSEFRQNDRTISRPQFQICSVVADVQAPGGERRGKAMANYPQEISQDAVCKSHTGHIIGLWFLLARPLRLNTNEWMNEASVHTWILVHECNTHQTVKSRRCMVLLLPNQATMCTQ